MSSTTPAEVLARRSQLILNGDADGFAALFAPDAVIESSFAIPGSWKTRPGVAAGTMGRSAKKALEFCFLLGELRSIA